MDLAPPILPLHLQNCMRNYARLLVKHGLNIQEGQLLNISGELIHRPLIALVAEEAYRCGAKYVNVDFIDPWQVRLRIMENRQTDYLNYVPGHILVKYEELVEANGAVLRFTGSEEPDCIADLAAAATNAVRQGVQSRLANYYKEGVFKSKVHWTVAAAATPKWALKVYPELDPQSALEALWNAIFKICRVDTPDYLEKWKRHNATLKKRAELLTQLKIKKLHFTGPDLDLHVYLHEKALFKGGGDISKRGLHYECNIPTEECFTTPDYRLTHGHAMITRPFFVNGKLIVNLKVEFKEGNLVNFEADEGTETFATYIQNDPGACRLGEVALVGCDSPIFQSGKVFQDILYDENAACHIAIGFAYQFCLEKSLHLTSEELTAIGCNESSVHTDMMISNEFTNVTAETYLGEQVILLESGKWQI